MSTQSIIKKSTAKKVSVNRLRIWVDLALFFTMVLVLAPQTTGIPVHEWLSFALLVPVLFHLTLSWKWIVSVTQRLFKRMPGETRFNYVWDWLLYFMFALAMFSGVVISESALPALGITLVVDSFWVALHALSATLTMVVIGVHIAMHWKWIVTHVNKYVLRRSVNATKAK